MGAEVNKLKIRDLHLTSLKQIIDERGGVFHYLKSNSETFKGFEEAYFSKINEGVVKGWKLHKDIHQQFCVPYGQIKVVLYDNRPNSPSYGQIDEIILNDNLNYKLLTIPPNLWYSFKCEASGFSLLANIINKIHDPLESITLEINTDKIPYEW
jgi:dTDP-4-dehydrorhamnose 3,5-epimerase